MTVLQVGSYWKMHWVGNSEYTQPAAAAVAAVVVAAAAAAASSNWQPVESVPGHGPAPHLPMTHKYCATSCLATCAILHCL